MASGGDGWEMTVFFKGLATETLSQAPMSIWVTQIGLGGFGGPGEGASPERNGKQV